MKKWRKNVLGPIAAVMIFSKDIKKTAHWYSRLTGIKPAIYEREQALINLGKVKLVFHLNDSKSPLSSGGQVAYWKVKDFDSVLKRAVKLGAKVHRGPKEFKELGIRIAQIKDPFGSVFGIEGKYKK